MSEAFPLTAEYVPGTFQEKGESHGKRLGGTSVEDILGRPART
jgi:hypothetical protein